MGTSLRIFSIDGRTFKYFGYFLAKMVVFVVCKYNPSHIVKDTRIREHLTKCKNNLLLQKGYKPCDYCRELTKPSELEEHVRGCTTRKSLYEMYINGLLTVPGDLDEKSISKLIDDGRTPSDRFI